VAVEKLLLAKLAKIKSRQEAPQSIFSGRVNSYSGAAVVEGTTALTVKTEGTPPDKMSVDEGSGDQEGSNDRASTRFQGDGHSSV
jgi:hypothetical protein